MTAYQLRPAWTPLTVVLTIAGFIVAWPLGVAMIAYILWGDRLVDEFPRLKEKFQRAAPSGFNAGFKGCGAGNPFRSSGNTAFDAYRQSVLKRLEDERRALVEEERAFADFLKSLREARDREEFDRYMAERQRMRQQVDPQV